MYKISVVMPVFNGAHWLDRSLGSIAGQEVAVSEVIVVDDASTDDSAGRASTWQDRIPLHLLRNGHNLGIGASLRKGVEAASGDWILRLDADDAWQPDHVASILSSLTRRPSAVMAAASAHAVDEHGTHLGEIIVPDDGTVRQRLMWDNPLVHSATAFSKSAYEAVGGYRLNTRWEDYDLWIRLLRLGALAQVAVPTVEYTVSTHSLSRIRRSDSIRGRWECQRRAIRAFGPRFPGAALRCLALGGLRSAVARWR